MISKISPPTYIFEEIGSINIKGLSDMHMFTDNIIMTTNDLN